MAFDLFLIMLNFTTYQMISDKHPRFKKFMIALLVVNFFLLFIDCVRCFQENG